MPFNLLGGLTKGAGSIVKMPFDILGGITKSLGLDPLGDIIEGIGGFATMPFKTVGKLFEGVGGMFGKVLSTFFGNARLFTFRN